MVYLSSGESFVQFISLVGSFAPIGPYALNLGSQTVGAAGQLPTASDLLNSTLGRD